MTFILKDNCRCRSSNLIASRKNSYRKMMLISDCVALCCVCCLHPSLCACVRRMASASVTLATTGRNVRCPVPRVSMASGVVSGVSARRTSTVTL